ncbi:unnamed protein product [Medioppia subpectinata]|uniref:C2H2-type domain-containing protein n=1 Tax=Medioppia subpectinata TaxID=1979941 RepID=A0A7R9KPG2_9ACAR|nr:unnamed protein product [Medioppia subpectinata]CAG2107080.1 unnamed protein product [Medioppia subpectinata]
MRKVSQNKRSLNAKKRNDDNKSGVEVDAEDVTNDGSVDHKLTVSIRQRYHQKTVRKVSRDDHSDSDLSPKRLRKQKFGQQLYAKDCHRLSHNNDNHLDSRQTQGIVCNICDQTFDTKEQLKTHIVSFAHHQTDPLMPFPELVESDIPLEGRIKCGKCRFRTHSEALMILHSINHNADTSKPSNAGQSLRLKCPTCDQSFTKALLRKHVYIHTSEKPFKCNECLQEFTTSSLLGVHLLKHNLRSDLLIICETCCATFKSRKGLQKHYLIHETDRKKSHFCDVCGDGFFDKESLKSHTIRKHLPKTERKFKCDFDGCRYSCLYQHQMLEHQKVHSDDKPWVCDQCDYTAKSKWTFRKHYRKHTKEKPFLCTECDYASSLSSNLTRHLRIHTGSKPFKCPYCAYQCNNHENLRKHVLNTRKHKGLYLYKCPHCQFATNVFTELRQHMEQNHNDIYTIEQIDQMISSIYHKHEDVTKVVPNPDSSSQQSSARKTPNKKRRKPKVNSVNKQTESCDEITQNETQNVLEDNRTINALIVGKNNMQNTSEIVIIDSNVLEAQEVCVSGQNNTHIFITI